MSLSARGNYCRPSSWGQCDETWNMNIFILRVFHRSRGDSKLPTTWENKRKLKGKGQQERPVGQEKGGRLVRGKGQAEKFGPRKKPQEVAPRRLEWQSETEGKLKKLRPGYLHYRKNNQTRRQENLGASQDKSKLSHSMTGAPKQDPTQLLLTKMAPL
jgi:hypothetical protein